MDTLKTLVIIDMQQYYFDKNEEIYNIVPVVSALIRHAIQNKWPIIFVEGREQDTTIEEITNIVDDYPHKTTVIKADWNGGAEVMECLNEHPSWPLNLLVCGIYGDYCVSATVNGLFVESDLVEIDVVTDAVYASGEGYVYTSAGREKVVTTEDLGIVVPEHCE